MKNKTIPSKKRVKSHNLTLELKSSKNRYRDGQAIEVPEGYRCPLCPDHDDDDFCWSALLQQPVCISCTYDIWNDFRSDDGSDFGEYALRKIMEITGLNFQQAKFNYLKESFKDKPIWKKIAKLKAHQLSDLELRSLNEQMLHELEMLIEKRMEGDNI